MIGIARTADHFRTRSAHRPAAEADTASDTSGFAPLSAELLRRARGEADRMIASARAEAAAEVARADRDAAEITERARTAGLARAATEAAARQRRSRLDDRAAVLSARRDAYDRWREAAIAAVLELRFAPGYDRIGAELRDAAHRLLGPDATITEEPGGGMVAENDSRRLDLRLATIAERAAEDIEPEIERLWR